MHVEELLELAGWYTREIPPIVRKYQAFLQPLQHNSSQGQKIPVLPSFEELEADLQAMVLEYLTIQQIQKLEELGVLQYLGDQGVMFIRTTIRTEQFDPATATERVNRVINSLNEVYERFQRLKTVLGELLYNTTLYEPEGDEAVVRVHFRGDAGINDVADWKKWSNDWYDISRGLALVAGEKPTDVKVLGANTGSIIMILGGTVTFVTLLAVIVKKLSGIVKEGLEIANSVEDLRTKKFLNGEIEQQLLALRKQREEAGITEAIEAVRTQLGGQIKAEFEATVQKSIEKYFNFYNKGGEVDIIAPLPDEAGDDEENVSETTKAIRDLNEAVQEIRLNQEALRLLAHHLLGADAAE